MLPRKRTNDKPRGSLFNLSITSLLILLLGSASIAGGIGAIWLLVVRPATGLEIPDSPGLAIVEFLAIGLIAGLLVFVRLRNIPGVSSDRNSRNRIITAMVGRLATPEQEETDVTVASETTEEKE